MRRGYSSLASASSVCNVLSWIVFFEIYCESSGLDVDRVVGIGIDSDDLSKGLGCAGGRSEICGKIDSAKDSFD